MATKIGFGTGAPQSTCGSRYPTKHIFRVKYSTPNPVPVCAGNLNVYPMKRTTCLKYKQTKNSDENTIEISVWTNPTMRKLSSPRDTRYKWIKVFKRW